MASDDTSTRDDQDTATAPGAVMAPPAPPVPPAPPGTAWNPPPGEFPRTRRMRSGGAVIGVLLVLAGLFAFFGGFTSVLDLLRLWPLLVIFGGVMQMLNPRGDAAIKRVAEGLGSVAVGLVFLGNSFGLIPWTVWIAVFSLWPLLLVALGIELVGRGLHLTWLRALSNVVLILGLAYAVFVLQPGAGRVVFPFVATSAATATFSDAHPHDAGVTTGIAEIKVGATRMSVAAGDKLATVSGRAISSETPLLEATVSGSTADVTITDPGRRTVLVATQDRTVDVTLDRAVRWNEVRLDVGAVSADMDLSGLDVPSVRVNAGASDARIKIGSRSKDVALDINGGAMSVTVLVPQSAACDIDASSGLSNVRVPASFRQTSGIVGIGHSSFASDGSGGPKITISLKSGVSDLRIETY